MQAMVEFVRPVLVINKMDRVLREQGLSPEQAYDSVCTIVDAFNTLVEAYQPDPALVGSWRVGTCAGQFTVDVVEGEPQPRPLCK